MRPCAEICEIALLIERNNSVIGKITNQLHLIGLVLLFHEFNRFFPGQFKAFQRNILLCNLFHFLFQSGQILIGKTVLQIKIIIKSVINRRADGQLSFGKQMFYRLCQNVRSRMPIYSAVLAFLKYLELLYGSLYCCVAHLSSSIKKPKHCKYNAWGIYCGSTQTRASL